MESFADTAALLRHQEAALGLLAREVACLDEGPDAMLAASAELRPLLAATLGGYQRFKHERIFDPAIASGDRQRMVLARHMKVACISAGEVFRTHMAQWPTQRIVDDWPDYKVAARLTANQLRRHIATEAEGITDLLNAYA